MPYQRLEVMVRLRSGGGADVTKAADLSSGEIVKEANRKKERKKDLSSDELVNNEKCEEPGHGRNTSTDARPSSLDRSKVKQFRSTFEGSADEGRLSISIEFVQCHHTSLQDMVMLRGESGRRWPVKCSLVGASTGTFRGYFTEGWKPFVEDNELEVGDTLIFNLLGESSFFIVRIPAISSQIISPEHTLAEESKPPADTESALPGDQMVEPPHLETPCAQFAVIISPTSSLSSPYPYLNLPQEFIHQYGTTLPRLVNLRGPRSAKVWPVKYTGRPAFNRGCFTRGWKDFVRDNSLKKGDHLTFTLTDASHIAVTYH